MNITIFTALFMLFLALKLMGYIDWSWWLVTAPLWGGIIITFLISFIFLLIAEVRRERIEERRRHK